LNNNIDRPFSLFFFIHVVLIKFNISIMNEGFFNIVISAAIPALIFVMGCLVTFIYEQIKKKREIVKTKTFITTWIDNSLKEIDVFISLINDFSKRLIDSDSLELVKTNFNIIHLNRINSFPLDKIMDSLFYNLKTSSNDDASIITCSIVKNIDFIEKEYKLILKHYDLYCHGNNELLNRFNIVFGEITKDISHKHRLNIDFNSPLYNFYFEASNLLHISEHIHPL
jgi:hypothetical protein